MGSTNHTAVFRKANLLVENKAHTLGRLITQSIRQKRRTTGTFCSKVPDPCTGKSFPQQRNVENDFIKKQRGLAVPHLGSCRQPTESAWQHRAPGHWVLPLQVSLAYEHIPKNRLLGLFPCCRSPVYFLPQQPLQS